MPTDPEYHDFDVFFQNTDPSVCNIWFIKYAVIFAKQFYPVLQITFVTDYTFNMN